MVIVLHVVVLQQCSAVFPDALTSLGLAVSELESQDSGLVALMGVSAGHHNLQPVLLGQQGQDHHQVSSSHLVGLFSSFYPGPQHQRPAYISSVL